MDATEYTFSLESGDMADPYAWIIEGVTPADVTENSIGGWVDVLIENERDRVISAINDNADQLVYPRYGFTTAQVFETPDEWVAWRMSLLDEDIDAERDSVTRYIESWLRETQNH